MKDGFRSEHMSVIRMYKFTLQLPAEDFRWIDGWTESWLVD